MTTLTICPAALSVSFIGGQVLGLVLQLIFHSFSIPYGKAMEKHGKAIEKLCKSYGSIAFLKNSIVFSKVANILTFFRDKYKQYLRVFKRCDFFSQKHVSTKVSYKLAFATIAKLSCFDSLAQQCSYFNSSLVVFASTITTCIVVSNPV